MELDNEKLDTILHRIEICSSKMEDLDDRAAGIYVKYSQKFISDEEYKKFIDDINKKKESVEKNMDKLKDDLEKLRN